MNYRYKDISGMRFGRLTAIEIVGKDKRKNALWKCKCDCGSESRTGSRVTAGRAAVTYEALYLELFVHDQIYDRLDDLCDDPAGTAADQDMVV